MELVIYNLQAVLPPLSIVIRKEIRTNYEKVFGCFHSFYVLGISGDDVFFNSVRINRQTTCFSI